MRQGNFPLYWTIFLFKFTLIRHFYIPERPRDIQHTYKENHMPSTPTPLHIHRGKDARVGIFVDAENIYYSLQQSLKEQFEPKRLNYKKFLDHCLAGRTAYCARFYDIVSDRFPKHSFHFAIRRHFEVFTKPLREFPDGTTKGDWDTGIAVDMIDLSDKLDVIVLCSGDGDFIPVVQYLQQKKHCRVEGVSFSHSTHPLLFKALNSHTDLNDPAIADLFR